MYFLHKALHSLPALRNTRQLLSPGLGETAKSPTNSPPNANETTTTTTKSGIKWTCLTSAENVHTGRLRLFTNVHMPVDDHESAVSADVKTNVN